MSPLDDELFEVLKKELQSQKLEATSVERVDLHRGEDSEGNPALFVRLILADPPEDEGTWPSGDVRKLRRLVRDAVLRMLHDDELRWYVSFETERPEITTDA